MKLDCDIEPEMEKRDAGLTIPYTIRDTDEKGRGIYASANISEGTIVWQHVAGQYTAYDETGLKDLLSDMRHDEAVYELTHLFSVAEFPGYMVRVFDDGVLINHSDNPSIATNDASGNYQMTAVSSIQDVVDALLNSHFSLIALRDIKAGEELTLDYNADAEDPLYYDALCDKYALTWDWL